MKRPNRSKKFESELTSVIRPSYVKNLEDYCDELEEKLAYIKDICETGAWSDDQENAIDILDIISGKYKEWF